MREINEKSIAIQIPLPWLWTPDQQCKKRKFFCEICGKKMKIESKDVYEPSRDPFELLVIGIITLFLAIFLAFTVVSMTI